MANRVRDCVSAFKNGSKPVEAKQLLSCIPEQTVVDVTTTFEFSSYGMIALVSLVHLAAYWGWENVATVLVSVYKCATNCKDKEGHIPLHYAAYNGHLEVVKYFIVETHCDPMNRNNDGGTPLHFACSNGHLNIAQYLIGEANCNPSCENTSGYTPLHFACSNGHLNIAQYLIREAKCNPSCENNSSETPLHKACGNGHLKIAQCLIREANCNPSCENNIGGTPLHYACRDGHLNIAQYLIREENCDPSCTETISRWTPLHFACVMKRANIVQYLLSTGRVNPLAKSTIGTALSVASMYDKDIFKLFQPFEKCKAALPLDTVTKMILIGDGGAGKSTIAKLIVHLPDSAKTAVANECSTAGIVPHYIQSKQAGIVSHFIQSKQPGNFVMYDFAGQQEYHSSHVAVLKQMMRRSAATFLCMIDLSKSKEDIDRSLRYWLGFVDNVCSTTEAGTSCVAIVGSHVDQVTPSEVSEKKLLLETIAAKRLKRQQYTGYLSMNCCFAGCALRHELTAILTYCQKAIAASQPVVSYNSHTVYKFLCTKLNMVGCTLHNLVSAIAKENHYSLPSDRDVLMKILTTLSDRGLILFIHHHQSIWVVVETKTLLNEIIGTLFAPNHFKEHRDLSSNTGIIPVSKLLEVFPKYNSDVLIGLLTSLDFCRLVDPSVLQYTNLQTTPSHSTADLLFFPGLIQLKRPDSLVQQGALNFGWCLRCKDPHESFSSRFLHVLLLLVAYKYFPLASQVAPSVSGLQCAVWRNGIFWKKNNITTVIELLENNQSVLVAMSCDDTTEIIEHAELRSSLIALVHHLQQQYCPHLGVREFLISPSLVQKYPLTVDIFLDSDLFDIHHVARSFQLHKKAVSSEDGHGYLPVEAFPFEPYHQLRSFSIRQLLDPDKADQLVPSSLLQEVRQLCRQSKVKPQKFCELREYLDSLSLFAGKNPLVSSIM